MKIRFMIGIVALAVLTACGKDSSSSKPAQELARADQTEVEPQTANTDGADIQGRYLAKFVTLNPHAVGTIPGSAQFLREEDKLSVFVRLFAGSPSVAHFQNVHEGSRCPTIADDTNGDGYIDIQETYSVVGKVLIPLDWDIGSQMAANRSWPMAFPNGSYEYSKATSFNRFLDDLKENDTNPEDTIRKLSADEPFTLTNRVVIIQGVEEAKILPPSVSGIGRWKNYQTLPIACGVFKPYTEDPGVEYEEGIPGPVGPVIEGQDRPAAPGEGEIPGTGGVITDGTTNDAGSNDSTPETGEPEPNE